MTNSLRVERPFEFETLEFETLEFEIKLCDLINFNKVWLK